MCRAYELAAMLFDLCHYTNRSQITTDFTNPTKYLATYVTQTWRNTNVLYTPFQVYYYLPVPIIEITTAALKTIFGNELFILIFLVAQYSLKLMSVRQTIILLQNKHKWV